ncbi:transposase [Cuspidothrix issatschenkoi LEGE 03284]|uniref:transposase n=1 Tax=Cuspidothrix issatschenkoi TaxID=230752 RepID=UPI001882B66E|nr:transposase [Cuspidothrix issatschenkoi]MBE9231810.1 transposase [Cuspidothrix issatschenkoi LEGE 03284]
MSRPPREVKSGYSYHITTRCNNREFHLTRLECREVFLYAIKKAMDKYGFKLYALCIMSNHVHYLLEPSQPEHLAKIMHWLNWYTAMCFNRMLNRSGHFWEKRYHSTGFANTDTKRTLNTLRYIHANPKAAGIQQGFFYDFSNYGTHDRLTDDGITQWHPAFLQLGRTLDECATKYRGFCKKYRPQAKPEKRNYWGSKLLARMRVKGKPKKTSRKTSPGQMGLPWDSPCNVTESTEVQEVTEKFIRANCYNSTVPGNESLRC